MCVCKKLNCFIDILFFSEVITWSKVIWSLIIFRCLHNNAYRYSLYQFICKYFNIIFVFLLRIYVNEKCHNCFTCMWIDLCQLFLSLNILIILICLEVKFNLTKMKKQGEKKMLILEFLVSDLLITNEKSKERLQNRWMNWFFFSKPMIY